MPRKTCNVASTPTTVKPLSQDQLDSNRRAIVAILTKGTAAEVRKLLAIALMDDVHPKVRAMIRDEQYKFDRLSSLKARDCSDPQSVLRGSLSATDDE